MNTDYLDPVTNPESIAQAGKLLREGEVVGIPTETVYGLAANALDPEAVRKIFHAKGRPSDNPLIVHIAEFDQIYDLVSYLPDDAWQLAAAFWPGPLTMILPKTDRVPEVVSAGLDTVGVRMPSHDLAQKIILAAGVPLAAPSANISGKPSPTSAQHVLSDMKGKISAVVDGGYCEVGVESTVISLVGERPRLLRPGAISLEMLQDVLGVVEVDCAVHQQIDEQTTVSAPGMKYRHYAPEAEVIVVAGTPEETAAYIQRHAEPDAGILCFDEYAAQFIQQDLHTLGAVSNENAHAQQLFDALRLFDSSQATTIYAQCPPEKGIGRAVANRLKKAAGFHVVEV